MGRIELPTSPLPRECSTTEPHGRYIFVTGAGEGNRTLVVSLEGFCSTIELHPQGSFRFPITTSAFWWRRLDSNQRRRKPTDLQSAPFSHSGTPPRREAGTRAKPPLMSTRAFGPGHVPAAHRPDTRATTRFAGLPIRRAP